MRVNNNYNSSNAISTNQIPHENLDQLATPHQWLQIYLIAVVLSNYLLLFFNGSGGDIGYWVNWANQLAANGYEHFDGNYPPIYIHWLYIVSQLYNYLSAPIENNIFLKYLAQIPVLASHLLLTYIVYLQLIKKAQSKLHFHAAMLLTALNPAILFNGPIWGQIDIIPVIPVIIGLLSGLSERNKIYCFPAFGIALLTKFQMIAFAPVFGILFFQNIRVHLKGLCLCIVVFVITFLPHILNHNFTQAFKSAYIDVLHQYSATTMGAANIWILLTGNAAPDSVILFGAPDGTPVAYFLKAKHFGMLCFFIVCLYIFIVGISNLIKGKAVPNQSNTDQNILFYAMVCAMAFFTLLPAMHERYLLPTVIISLLYFSINASRPIYPILFSFISAFNLAMCLGIKTESVWSVISWLMVIAFSYGILDLLLKRTWQIFIKDMFSKLVSIKHLAIWTSAIVTYFLSTYLLESNKIHSTPLSNNQQFLTQLTPTYTHQDYGTLKIDQSINGNILSVGGKRYAHGFGTHANSEINFTLPANTSEISFIAGIDNEVESASAIFSVWGDQKLLWQSKPHFGKERRLTTIHLKLDNISQLSLKISGMDDLSNDHVDWVEPVLTLTH